MEAGSISYADVGGDEYGWDTGVKGTRSHCFKPAAFQQSNNPVSLAVNFAGTPFQRLQPVGAYDPNFTSPPKDTSASVFRQRIAIIQQQKLNDIVCNAHKMGHPHGSAKKIAAINFFVYPISGQPAWSLV
jgi:hypothetical protein